MRESGRPSASTVDRATALGSFGSPLPASASQSSNRWIGSPSGSSGGGVAWVTWRT
jgi:hypothetical protein